MIATTAMPSPSSIPGKILAEMIFLRISEAVDLKLGKGKSGFCKGKGCDDQIVPILLGSIPRSVPSRDFLNPLIVYTEILRKVLWAHDIRHAIVEIIQRYSQHFTYTIGDSNITCIKVKISTQQCHVMFFHIVIDWLLQHPQSTGIQQTLLSSLAYLDYADDTALLFHNSFKPFKHLDRPTDQRTLGKICSKAGPYKRVVSHKKSLLEVR